MNHNRDKRINAISVSAFSGLALFFHMAALKLIYHSISLLLKANEASPELRREIAVTVESLKNNSNACTNLFYLVSYLFAIFLGAMLIADKINIKKYLIDLLIFGSIQFLGIALFIQLFNQYELTEGYARLRIILRHKLFWFVLIIPIMIHLAQKSGKKREGWISGK